MTAPFDPEKAARKIVEKGWMKAHDVDSAQRDSIYYAVGDRLESLIVAALRDVHEKALAEGRRKALPEDARERIARALSDARLAYRANAIRPMPLTEGGLSLCYADAVLAALLPPATASEATAGKGEK